MPLRASSGGEGDREEGLGLEGTPAGAGIRAGRGWHRSTWLAPAAGLRIAVSPQERQSVFRRGWRGAGAGWRHCHHRCRVSLPPVPSLEAPPRPWRLPSLLLSLLLLSAAVGSVVLVAVAAFAFVPLLLGALLVAGWILALLLLGWAGLEALAAVERWLETDPRFHR